MQEIEAKQQIGAQEGAHFFFTLSFIALTSLIYTKYSSVECPGVNISLLVDLVFAGLIIWATYLIITILPNCKNTAVNQFFTFMHGLFAVYMLAAFIYANFLYFDDSFTTNNCLTVAPVLTFFISLFLIVGYVVLIIIGLSLISSIFRKFSKTNINEAYAIEEL